MAFYNNGPDETWEGMWAVGNYSSYVPYTHACGVPIHYMVGYRMNLISRLDPYGVQPYRTKRISHVLDPHHILSAHYLDLMRCMYPRSVGVRLGLCGDVQILYPGPGETVMMQDASKWVNDYIDYSQTILMERLVVRASKKAPGATATNGLRLTLPDGTPVLTTVTHDHVRLPGNSLLSHVVDCYVAVKDTACRSLSSSISDTTLPYTSTQDCPTSNTPLGTSLPGEKISHCYDAPSAFSSYPSGYQHDLSLITPSGYGKRTSLTSLLDNRTDIPRIDGWGSIRDALGGTPLFTIPASPYGKVREAIAEGTQYLRDKEAGKQFMALLWRTAPLQSELEGLSQEDIRARTDEFQKSDYSGDLLCVGRPTDKTAKALLFQNFSVSPCVAESPTVFNVQGGFALPALLYERCRIQHQAPVDNTMPKDSHMEDSDCDVTMAE